MRKSSQFVFNGEVAVKRNGAGAGAGRQDGGIGVRRTTGSGWATAAVTAWLVLSAFAAPTEGAVQGEMGREMDRLVRNAEAFGFSGHVLVAVEGRPVLHRAYGFADAGERHPMELDTPVGIASISKQFAAAALLKLESLGRLSLDDSLSAFFDDMPGEKRAITLRHLVTHTSGLRSRYSEDFEPHSQEKLIRGILETPAAFDPGERWQYSAAGYNLIAAAIERTTGRPYEEALHELLIEPAGPERTGFLSRLPEGAPAPAHAYLAWDDRGSPERWPRNWRNFGAGDMVSTAADLHAWERALREGRVLSSDALERFYEPLVEVDAETSYGFGLFFHRDDTGRRVVEHGGDAALGFNGSLYRYVDEDLVVVVTSSTRGPQGQFLRHAIGLGLERLARGEDVGGAAVFDARLLSLEDIERLAGSYRAEGGGRLEVLSDGAHLWIAAADPKASSFLSSHSNGEAEAVEMADTKTGALLEGLLRGDSTAYHTALTEDGMVHFPDYWGEWTGLVEGLGPYSGYQLLGSRPLGGDVLSQARLRFFRGTLTITYFWQEEARGRLAGTFVAGGGFRPTVALPLAIDAETGALVAHDPVGGTTIRMRVGASPSDARVTLVLELPGGEVEVTRTGLAGWIPPPE